MRASHRQEDIHAAAPWLPLDTILEAAQVQTAVFQRVFPERRLQMAFDMIESIIRAGMEGVRSRHPEYTPRQVELAVIRMRLGEDLFRLAYPAMRTSGHDPGRMLPPRRRSA
jgi:hypothetical protein